MSAIERTEKQSVILASSSKATEEKIEKYNSLMQMVKKFFEYQDYNAEIDLLRTKIMPLSQTLGEDYLREAESWLLGARSLQGKCIMKNERYDEAEKIFRSIFESALNKYPLEACAALINQSMSQHHLGKYPQEKESLEEAEKLLEKLDNQPEKLKHEGLINERYGLLYYRLADYPRSIGYLQEALGVTGQENKEAIATLSGNLGLCYLELGEHDKAMENFKKDEEINKELGKRQEAIAASINIGNCWLDKKGEQGFKEAKKVFSKILKESGLTTKTSKQAKNGLANTFLRQGRHAEAISHYEPLVAQKGLTPREKGEFNYNLGESYFSNKQFEQAENVFRQSIAGFNELQSSLENTQWQITIFELQVQAYLKLERLLIDQVKPEEAIEVSDRRRSRVLMQNLVKKHLLRLDKLLTDQHISAQQMQQLARRQNTVFIIYSLSLFLTQEDDLIAWIIPPEGEIQNQTFPSKSLIQDIKGSEELLKDFPFERKRSNEIAIPSIENLSFRGEEEEYDKWLARLSFVEEKLAKWHEILIAPIEKFLPKDPKQTVTIIPDGFLTQLPFAAFQGEDGKFLIEKHPISIAPSIKAIQLLDKVRGERKLNPLEESLVIGNPLAPNKKSLKIGQVEAENIGKLLHMDEKDVLRQKEATVSRFLEKASGARFIFASCHGEAGCKPKFNPHSVFEGQLNLTPCEEHPSGNLHSEQISGLNLSAELVFLSACYSGTGKVQQEGAIGNVWSFLAAGALSTVATYWPLPESETTRLMVNRFFHHLLGVKGFTKLNKAQALQEAMLLGMKENRDRFDQWGAFYLSGLS